MSQVKPRWVPVFQTKPEKTPPKPRKPLPHFNEKRTRQEREYIPLKNQYLLDHRMCEFPGCLNHSQSLHHKKGRGKYLCEVKYFMATCVHHHAWIEDNKRAARAMKLILYR